MEKALNTKLVTLVNLLNGVQILGESHQGQVEDLVRQVEPYLNFEVMDLKGDEMKNMISKEVRAYVKTVAKIDNLYLGYADATAVKRSKIDRKGDALSDALSSFVKDMSDEQREAIEAYYASDLFEHPELLPKQVRKFLENYEDVQGSAAKCRELLDKLEKKGYSFEFSMDAQPYNLRRMGGSGLPPERPETDFDLGDFLEVHYVVATEIEDYCDRMEEWVPEALESMGHRMEKSREWASEFMRRHGNTDWDSSEKGWYDTLETFVADKIFKINKDAKK